MKTTHMNTRKIVMTAMFAAIASVLMFLNFNVPFMPSFIKFDFSELPALLAAYSLGPVSGVLVCLVKNAVNLTSTITGGVGELSNFLLGCAFVLPAGLIYKWKKTRRSAFLGAVIGMFSMATIGIFTNYFVVYPIYMKIMPIDVIIGMYQAIFPEVDGLLACLLVFNFPFTLLKGAVNAAIAFVVYKRISPFIKGDKSRKKQKGGREI